MDEADRELLRRAEAEVAALPRRDPLVGPPPGPGAGRAAGADADAALASDAALAEAEPTGRARLLAPLTIVVCVLTAWAESSWLWFPSAEWTTVLWLPVPLLVAGSIVLALVAGAVGGRAGRWAGVCGGIAVVPPVCFVVSLPLGLFA